MQQIAAALPLLLLCFACVDEAALAEKSLADDGMTEIEIVDAGKKYEFTARRGDEHCSGSVIVSANWRGSNVGISKSTRCVVP